MKDLKRGKVSGNYAFNKLKAAEVHVYGVDSIFDFNMKSCTDF